MNFRKSITSLVAATVLGTSLIAGFVSLPGAAVAAKNMTPNYEIHLLLDPTVSLNADKTLNSSVMSAFNITAAPIQMNVQYMDNNNKDLNTEGWSTRIRKVTGDSEKSVQLNYKKRYAINGTDITSALNQANAEGFDANDTNYDAQVEWGYLSKTLSISVDKSANVSGYSGLTLPNQADSVQAVVKNIPGKLDKWKSAGWGTTVLNASRIYGPIYATRYTGTWNGLKTYIEVWPIKNAAGTGFDYTVEASFKVDTQTDAANYSNQMMTLLQSKGWFLPQDALKTSTIMQRY